MAYQISLLLKCWHFFRKLCFLYNIYINRKPRYFYNSTMKFRSMVNEGIRTILNLFIFFYEKISHTQKNIKRIQANKKKRGIICMRIKNIEGEESHLFSYLRLCDFYAFCAFYAHKSI